MSANSVHHDQASATASGAPQGERVFDDILQAATHQTTLLLAIAKDDVADAAISVTAALAERRNAAPTVLEVVDPSSYAPPIVPTVMQMADALIGEGTNQERCRAIAARVEKVCGPVTWPIVSRLGNPAACIADEAHQRHSELLVLGLHHHGKADSLLGTETTIHVVTRAGIPVIGVTRAMCGLPRRILVGVDFGRASWRVARLAARLIEPPGHLVLAHVAYPRPTTMPEDLEGDEAIFSEGIHALFEHLKRDIQPREGVRVKTVRLTGEPGRALTEYAESMNPDMIAVASQQHSRIVRLLLGSVSRHIIRDGRWSVLVTPPV